MSDGNIVFLLDGGRLHHSGGRLDHSRSDWRWRGGRRLHGHLHVLDWGRGLAGVHGDGFDVDVLDVEGTVGTP